MFYIYFNIVIDCIIFIFDIFIYFIDLYFLIVMFIYLIILFSILIILFIFLIFYIHFYYLLIMILMIVSSILICQNLSAVMFIIHLCDSIFGLVIILMIILLNDIFIIKSMEFNSSGYLSNRLNRLMMIDGLFEIVCRFGIVCLLDWMFYLLDWIVLGMFIF